MNVTNIINSNDLTIIQGVNGLFMFQETWTRKQRTEQFDAEEQD